MTNTEPVVPVDEPDGDLDPEARRLWGDMASQLTATGVGLDAADRASLRLYATTEAELRRVSARLEAEGFVLDAPNRTVYANPLVKVEQALRTRLAAALTQLGASPLSRRRLHGRASEVKKPAEWIEVTR